MVVHFVLRSGEDTQRKPPLKGLAVRVLLSSLIIVGNLKCIARQCIKSSEGRKGSLSEPPRTTPGYRLDQGVFLTCILWESYL